MATYTAIPSSVPSSERSSQITAIAVGDQVDVTAILGRPARGIIFTTTDAADSVSYKLNHRIRVDKIKDDAQGDISAWMRESVYFWSPAAGVTYTSTGATIQTVDGLNISSFEITAMTLGTGSTITAVVW